jgi:PleD family two-component response regulator
VFWGNYLLSFSFDMTLMMPEFMKDKKIKVLVAEPDTKLLKYITDSLKELPLQIIGLATSAFHFKQLFLEDVPDLIIAEVLFSDKTSCIDIIKELDPFAQVPIIYLSTSSEKNLVSQAQETFAFNFLLHNSHDLPTLQLKIAVEMALNFIVR